MSKITQNQTRNSLPETWIRITNFESYSCEKFPPNPLILNNRESRVFTWRRKTHRNSELTKSILASYQLPVTSFGASHA